MQYDQESRKANKISPMKISLDLKPLCQTLEKDGFIAMFRLSIHRIKPDEKNQDQTQPQGVQAGP